MSDSRVEAILENMLGADNTLQPPQSRVEALLQEIAENGAVFVVNISSNGTYSTADKTFDQLKDAWNKDIPILFISNAYVGALRYIQTTNLFAGSTLNGVPSTNRINLIQCGIKSDNSVIVSSKAYDLSSLVI